MRYSGKSLSLQSLEPLPLARGFAEILLSKTPQIYNLTRERWRLLIFFMRWHGGFHDPMEKKPFLSIYE